MQACRAAAGAPTVEEVGMRAKWMGVALAAVMAYGWASGAQSAPISGQPYVSFSGDVLGMGPDNYNTGASGSNLPSNSFLSAGFYSFGGVEFDFPSTKYRIDVHHGSYDSQTGTIIDIDLQYSKYYDVPMVDGSIYLKSAYLESSYFTTENYNPKGAPTTFTNIETISSFLDYSLGVGGEGIPDVLGELDLTSLTLVPLPIPPTILLFGGALIGFGGAGYARRRRKVAQAA